MHATSVTVVATEEAAAWSREGGDGGAELPIDGVSARCGEKAVGDGEMEGGGSTGMVNKQIKINLPEIRRHKRFCQGPAPPCTRKTIHRSPENSHCTREGNYGTVPHYGTVR